MNQTFKISAVGIAAFLLASTAIVTASDRGERRQMEVYRGDDLRMLQCNLGRCPMLPRAALLQDAPRSVTLDRPLRRTNVNSAYSLHNLRAVINDDGKAIGYFAPTRRVLVNLKGEAVRALPTAANTNVDIYAIEMIWPAVRLVGRAASVATAAPGASNAGQTGRVMERLRNSVADYLKDAPQRFAVGTAIDVGVIGSLEMARRVDLEGPIVGTPQSRYSRAMLARALKIGRDAGYSDVSLQVAEAILDERYTPDRLREFRSSISAEGNGVRVMTRPSAGSRHTAVVESGGNLVALGHHLSTSDVISAMTKLGLPGKCGTPFEVRGPSQRGVRCRDGKETGGDRRFQPKAASDASGGAKSNERGK
ncbi:MAG: hypothetical protein HY078_03140 [Elusimicrobia bacterium]|nr:hypothetical protein [Elusimicrobiota bacterium]